jgi:hypothetical protein
VQKSIGGRSRTHETRIWRPVCFRSAPTKVKTEKAARIGIPMGGSST